MQCKPKRANTTDLHLVKQAAHRHGCGGNTGWLQALNRTTATVQSAWGSGGGGIIIIQYDLTSKKRTFGENSRGILIDHRSRYPRSLTQGLCYVGENNNINENADYKYSQP